MEAFAGMIIGFVMTFLVFSFFKIGKENDLINEINEERRQRKALRKDLDNAESRVQQYARIIKRTEDIINSKGTIVDKFDKIKELLTDGNQDK